MPAKPLPVASESREREPMSRVGRPLCRSGAVAARVLAAGLSAVRGAYGADRRIERIGQEGGLVAVRADIGTGLVPAPGTPDAYTILVGDGGGNLIYSFSALVENGDVAVETVP